MLYAFKKYSIAGKINKNIQIKITNKAQQNQIKSMRSVRYINKVLYHSIFMRKSYFRSILLYTNVLYSNFAASVDANYFYPYKYVIIMYTNNHPGFYFRNCVIR